MTTQNKYTQQAETFLKKHNIKFRATLKDSKPCHWKDENSGKCGHHYRVTLIKPKRPALVFDFWGSIANSDRLADLHHEIQEHYHPSSYDVLACISSDIHCPDTHKDFCSAMGYEIDSIKGLQTFRRCLAFSKRLNQFFTAAEIKDLEEIQ